MRRPFTATPAVVVLASGLTVFACLGIHWAVTLAALASLATLALVQPAMVVAAVIASIPVQSSVMLPFVRGEITLTQLAVFGLVAGWGVVFWQRRIWLDSIVVGFLLVLAAYTISFMAVDDPGLWFQETYRWAIAGVFYVICRSVIDTWQVVRYCLWAMIAGVIGISVMSLWQLVSESGPSDFQVGGAVRVYGTFGTPNTLAAYLEMTVPLFLACIPLAWRKSGSGHFSHVEKWLLTLASGAGVLVILLTQSRGGWVGIALGFTVLWWQVSARTRIVSLVAAVIVVGGFLLTPPGQSQFERFMSLQDEAAQVESAENRSSYEVGAGRGALWSTAILMIEDRPLTGIGAGEFDENYREYVSSWIDRLTRGQAHNVWLQMGAQAGIWGMAAYAVWFAASVWSVITARRRARNDREYWLITGVLAVFVAYTAHSMVDYLNVLSLGLQLSALTAIALNLVPEPLSRYVARSQPVHSTAVPEPA